MNKLHKLSLFIFRRDYRIHDNIGLIKSLNHSHQVIPIFIFNPKQIKYNKFKSNNATQFMIESLIDLDSQLKNKGSKLYLFYGDIIQIIKKFIKEIYIDAIFFNKDYSPFSLKRDSKIKKLCLSQGIALYMIDDLCLHPMGSIMTNKNDGYKKFNSYYRKAKKYEIMKPISSNIYNFYNKDINFIMSIDPHSFYTKNHYIKLDGGRSFGKSILRNIKYHSQFDTNKDDLTLHTSLLSPYIRFGCLSIREVYHYILKVLNNTNLLKQLFWRDFYYNLGYYNLKIFTSNYTDPRFKYIQWDNDTLLFKLWCEGKTGFPLCDAGMRELNYTGFIHHRVRMLTATVLCRILLINWRWGERYFATKLIDHDRALNEGNWLYITGTSSHSQDYYRIMTPRTQNKKYDPDCIYIKKWIPELKYVPSDDIIHWDTRYKKYKFVDYPSPCVNYKKNKNESITRYKNSIEKYENLNKF